MNSYFKKIAKVTISLLAFIMKFNFFNHRIIIIQSYDDKRYCDNTRYLFEYLSSKKIYSIYWTTEDIRIQKYLNSKNFKFISIKSNFLLYVYVFANAKIIINPGSNYHDLFNLISSSTIKITTSHGVGPKLTITPTFDIYNSNKEILEINNFDYINLTADFVSIESGVKKFKIPDKKIINLGFPRCDQFFDKDSIKRKYNAKIISKELIDNFSDNNSKVIYYTPTWRPYDYTFPLNLMKNFDYQKFNDFLLKTNSFFVFTLHSERAFSKLPDNLNRIKFLNTKNFPLFDSNMFMTETSILINDYSTTSTDYCLLERPQIFFMPDFKKYNEVKGFIEDYKKIIPGKEIHDYDEFIELIKVYLEKPESYNKDYDSRIEIYMEKYYDKKNYNSCELFDKFIYNLVKNK